MSDRSESAFVAREIRRLVSSENFQYKDIALLYRTNAQSRVLEEKLMQLDIPYIIVGGLKFYARKEIKDILAYLRLIINHSDNISLLRIINVPRRGFGPKNIERLTEYAMLHEMSIFDVISRDENLKNVPQLSPRIRQKLRDFASMISGFGEMKSGGTDLPEFIKSVLETTEYIAMLQEGKDSDKPESISRIENLGAFVNGAADFVNINDDPTLDNFLNHVALLTDLDEVKEEDSRVSLMTVHSAKGLEFPVVFITGMEEGLLPHANSIADTDQLEEERRICYVAMTRAKQKLYITAAEERKNFGRTYSAKVSSFIKEIPRECITGMSEKNASSDVSHHLAPARKSVETKVATPAVSAYADRTYTPKIPERQTIAWKVGDKVKHKKWGLGTVTASQGGYLKINFVNPEIGEKMLKSVTAPIEKADE